MKSFYFPLLLTIGGNVLYHISQKSIPKTVSPLTTMVLAYIVAIVICLFSMIFYPTDKSFMDSVRQSNWTILTIGLGIAAVEIGFLLAYRVGWNISIAPVFSSVALALLLVPIGIVVFKERLSVWNIVGIVFCAVGLALVAKK
jgi:uncharacterized membrane protein